MIEAKAGSACHSSAIAQFSKAIAPACAPYLRPAGKAEIDYFGFKLIVDVLIRGPLDYGESNCCPGNMEKPPRAPEIGLPIVNRLLDFIYLPADCRPESGLY